MKLMQMLFIETNDYSFKINGNDKLMQRKCTSWFLFIPYKTRIYKMNEIVKSL